MESWLKKLGSFFKYTILHPQWLSHRYHKASQKILKTLNDSVILEIGSGDSNIGTLINSSNQLIKLDYPATNQRYNQAPDIFADSAKLPVADSSVDTALFLEVAEHVAHDKESIQEIYRILKPGGKFYFSIPFIYPMHDQPYDFRRYTLHGIKSLLSENGFEILKIIRHGNSLVTALQLVNLSILELCKNALDRNSVTGLLLILFSYPICILINLLALIAIPINNLNAACLGYFVIANKHEDKLIG